MNTSYKILLVEDHHLMRQGLRRLIETETNMQVVGEAFDKQSTLSQVRQLKPDFVIMDLFLGEESGIEIGQQIWTEFPESKLIALTSDSSPQTALKAIRAGFSGYVIKENQMDELVRAIRVAATGKLYLCPTVSSIVTRSLMENLCEEQTLGQPELTDREQKLLVLVAEGKRSKEIAESLEISARCVDTYRSRLMKKLGCASVADLTRYAVREGLVRL